jgi:hypothetical protein
MRAHQKETPRVSLPASVKKIIPSTHHSDPEKAEIHVQGADPLYEEIRIENSLKDENGEEVRLKEGAKVKVTVEAPTNATIPKRS